MRPPILQNANRSYTNCDNVAVGTGNAPLHIDSFGLWEIERLSARNSHAAGACIWIVVAAEGTNPGIDIAAESAAIGIESTVYRLAADIESKVGATAINAKTKIGCGNAE